VIVSSSVRTVGWHGLANRDLEVPAWPVMRRLSEDSRDRSLLLLLFVIELLWVGGLIWFAARSL
jgi:hypothetical protein